MSVLYVFHWNLTEVQTCNWQNTHPFSRIRIEFLLTFPFPNPTRIRLPLTPWGDIVAIVLAVAIRCNIGSVAIDCRCHVQNWLRCTTVLKHCITDLDHWTSLKALYRSLRPLDNSLKALYRSLRPLDNSLKAFYHSLRPLDNSLKAFYHSLRPLHNSLKALYRSLRPLHNSLKALYRSLRPLHNSLKALKCSLRPLHNSLKSIVLQS